MAARKTQTVSGNHLLNFHYDPISRSQSRALPPPRRQSRRKPYNKDLFLQANFKFVILDTGEYTLETMDPDKKLQWEDIICVKYSNPFPVQCPICLGSPLCPQITSCGHIFCFPCILQYFFMDQDDHRGECYKKCPLCFTMISPKDLYTVYIENVKQYSIGDTIEFILLTRQKDSFTLSLKHNEGPSSDEEILHSFSKFTLTSDVDLSVREAIADLDNWLARSESGLVDDLEKLPYVCAAMEQLEQRKKNWNKHQIPGRTKIRSSSSGSYGSSPKPQKAADTVCKDTGFMFGTLPLSNDESDWSGKSPPDKINGKSHVVETADFERVEVYTASSSCEVNKINNKSSISNDFTGINDKNSYSFYQAADGQHIILHSLNMKCLLHHYGNSDRIPNRIRGKILQMEMVTQSEATRKRFRYLSHISLTTAYQLCEIDLRDMVPPAALSPFMDEIKNREKQRKHLAKKERQEKIKAESAGLDLVPLQYDIAPESSFYGSPSFSMDDFEALGSSNVVSSSPPAYGERQLFSNVARLGFAAGYDSPGLKNGESQSFPQNDVPVIVSGSMSTSTPSFASITSRAKPANDPDNTKLPETGKKGKKSSRILLSTSGGRRY
ncbi:hypothetical protein Leryth_009278 [Lithospermum erythrorhizon]|nr:hypothetical protein Leryth_009278 [Lithospermum erythrorhizon]